MTKNGRETSLKHDLSGAQVSQNLDAIGDDARHKRSVDTRLEVLGAMGAGNSSEELVGSPLGFTSLGNTLNRKQEMPRNDSLVMTGSAI